MVSDEISNDSLQQIKFVWLVSLYFLEDKLSKERKEAF